MIAGTGVLFVEGVCASALRGSIPAGFRSGPGGAATPAVVDEAGRHVAVSKMMGKQDRWMEGGWREGEGRGKEERSEVGSERVDGGRRFECDSSWGAARAAVQSVDPLLAVCGERQGGRQRARFEGRRRRRLDAAGREGEAEAVVQRAEQAHWQPTGADAGKIPRCLLPSFALLCSASAPRPPPQPQPRSNGLQ
ncbi:hypothetical protein L1887_58621 [Cichorium endivia]|nr:hypothetical protein L1887_58621 [Cichorium endivia]